jgi:hypothetical protein
LHTDRYAALWNLGDLCCVGLRETLLVYVLKSRSNINTDESSVHAHIHSEKSSYSNPFMYIGFCINCFGQISITIERLLKLAPFDAETILLYVPVEKSISAGRMCETPAAGRRKLEQGCEGNVFRQL